MRWQRRAGTWVHGSCLSREVWTQDVLSIQLGAWSFFLSFATTLLLCPRWNVEFGSSPAKLRWCWEWRKWGHRAGPGRCGHTTSLPQGLLEGRRPGGDTVGRKRSRFYGLNCTPSFLFWPPGLHSTCSGDLPQHVRRRAWPAHRRLRRSPLQHLGLWLHRRAAPAWGPQFRGRTPLYPSGVAGRGRSRRVGCPSPARAARQAQAGNRALALRSALDAGASRQTRARWEAPRAGAPRGLRLRPQ